MIRRPRGILCTIGIHSWGGWENPEESCKNRFSKPLRVVGCRACLKCGTYQVMETVETTPSK